MAPPMVLAAWIILGAAISLQAEDWKLVWSDEFSGQGLPDSSKWSTETGFLRNEEKQYYTGNRTENVRQDNDLLILECRREDWVTPEGGTARFTSGSVTTKGKATWTYGRLEVRARMPAGKGSWASLWLMGVADFQGKPWPACGEIDISEHVGKHPDEVFGTVHFQKDGRHQQKAFKTDEGKPEHGFHLYSAEWDPDRIAFYLDGEEYGSFDVWRAQDGDRNPFQEPFYLTISFALGGNWGGEIYENALPQQLLVDFVRVYQKEGKPAARPVWEIKSSRSR